MRGTWKHIKNYEGKYTVSNRGRIKSHIFKYGKRNIPKILSPGNQGRGYMGITLSRNGKSKSFLVHRLVALAFISNPLNKPQINHKNGIKSDNSVENLEWATDYENRIHSARNGLNTRIYKLNLKDVRKIRRLRANNKFSYGKLAKMFNVGWSNISVICRNKSWNGGANV